MPFVVLVLSFLMGALVTSCKRSEKFPDIGLSLASPQDVVADKTGGYFYVLNVDYPRDYDTGSLVVLNSNGDKLSSMLVPRLGRSLARANDYLLATFSNLDDEGGPNVQLFDISTPTAPKLVKRWDIDGRCNPNNAIMRENPATPGKNYDYFAVSCANGMLMVGQFSTMDLKLVRNYPGNHRAMHFNVARNLLIGFPTNINAQTWVDKVAKDALTYADEATATATDGANDIPDDFEADAFQRRNKLTRGKYQFYVYDLAAATTNKFPYIEDINNPDIQKELHWVYFNLLNFDGTPDLIINSANDTINSKYYRTNFWQALPDPNTDDTFYLSHRGYSASGYTGSPHANSIIKVQLTGDITQSGFKTEDVLSFQRVYGFKGELDPNGRYYPMGFQIQQVRGQPLLVVNNQRDLINFPNQYYFSLAAKVLGSNSWFTEKATTDVGRSYSQIALTPSGRGLAISFYGNVAILLDAYPGTDINEIKTIN